MWRNAYYIFREYMALSEKQIETWNIYEWIIKEINACVVTRPVLQIASISTALEEVWVSWGEEASMKAK